MPANAAKIILCVGFGFRSHCCDIKDINLLASSDDYWSLAIWPGTLNYIADWFHYYDWQDGFSSYPGQKVFFSLFNFSDPIETSLFHHTRLQKFNVFVCADESRITKVLSNFFTEILSFGAASSIVLLQQDVNESSHFSSRFCHYLALHEWISIGHFAQHWLIVLLEK